MSQLVADLKAVRELLAVPERWTVEYLARNSDGKNVPDDDPAATRFCLVGAIYKISIEGGETSRYGYELGRVVDLIRFIGEVAYGHQLPPRSLADWNDQPGRTHAEVLALLDKAIATAEVSA